jgi:hypothetical protein
LSDRASRITSGGAAREAAAPALEQRQSGPLLQGWTRGAAAGSWTWQRADGSEGALDARWLAALQALTAGRARPEASLPAGAALLLRQNTTVVGRLLLRGNELWACSPEGACEVSRAAVGRDSELAALWQAGPARQW